VGNLGNLAQKMTEAENCKASSTPLWLGGSACILQTRTLIEAPGSSHDLLISGESNKRRVGKRKTNNGMLDIQR
jgi:hypothetical protein